MQNSEFWIRISSLDGTQPSSVVLCIQNSDFSIRITSLYGSQTSPMVFCIQNSAFSHRIASLYGSQPSSVVLCIHNSYIMTRINSLYGSQTSPVVLSMQNNVINIVSMCPSLRLWILHAKQRLLDQNYKSLWVPALTCGFCMQNSDFWIIITSLYGSQPSLVVFALKTATLASEILVSMCPSPHLWFMHAKQRL